MSTKNTKRHQHQQTHRQRDKRTVETTDIGCREGFKEQDVSSPESVEYNTPQLGSTSKVSHKVTWYNVFICYNQQLSTDVYHV